MIVFLHILFLHSINKHLNYTQNEQKLLLIIGQITMMSKPYRDRLKRIITILIFFTFVFSCNNSNEFNPNTLIDNHSMKELSVDEARDWYNNFNKNSRTNKEGNTPIWGDAVQRKVSDNESIVVVPLLIVNNLSFSINDNQRMKSENDYISSDIKTNLVFMKTENKIEQLEMRIISSDAYSLKRTKLESKDFDGYVYFFDSNQKFHSGLVYENGRITGTMRNSIKSGKNNKNNNNNNKKNNNNNNR